MPRRSHLNAELQILRFLSLWDLLFCGRNKRAVLDGVLFVVINTVAVNVYFYFELVFLTRIVFRDQVVGEAVLAPKECVDLLQVLRDLAFKGHFIVLSAGFFGEGIHLVFGLKKGQSARHTREAVGGGKLVFVSFEKEIAGADYVYRNARLLHDFSDLAVVNSAERVDGPRKSQWLLCKFNFGQC